MPPAVVSLFTHFVLVGRNEVPFIGLFIIKAKLGVVYYVCFIAFRLPPTTRTFRSSWSTASSTRKHKRGAAVTKKQVDIRGSHHHVGIGSRQRSIQEFLDDGHVKDTGDDRWCDNSAALTRGWKLCCAMWWMSIRCLWLHVSKCRSHTRHIK